MPPEKRQMEEKLRASGLRVTPQRRAVWSAFEGGESGHLTAEEVLHRARRELPEIARATVYNSLAALVDAGLLRVVDGRGAVLYDPNPDPTHHHFRCRSCDRLYDVHVEGIEGMRVAGEGEFVVEGRTVFLTGLCPRCAPAAK